MLLLLEPVVNWGFCEIAVWDADKLGRLRQPSSQLLLHYREEINLPLLYRHQNRGRQPVRGELTPLSTRQNRGRQSAPSEVIYPTRANARGSDIRVDS